jgi:hypothetical protein
MTIMRPSFGIDRELDVRAARLDADLADDRERRVAHQLVFAGRVSVCAGATVIESPVCTPIGSKFSIEQMMTHVVGAVAHRPPARTPSSRAPTPR